MNTRRSGRRWRRGRIASPMRRRGGHPWRQWHGEGHAFCRRSSGVRSPNSCRRRRGAGRSPAPVTRRRPPNGSASWTSDVGSLRPAPKRPISTVCRTVPTSIRSISTGSTTIRRLGPRPTRPGVAPGLYPTMRGTDWHGPSVIARSSSVPATGEGSGGWRRPPGSFRLGSPRLRCGSSASLGSPQLCGGLVGMGRLHFTITEALVHQLARPTIRPCDAAHAWAILMEAWEVPEWTSKPSRLASARFRHQVGIFGWSGTMLRRYEELTRPRLELRSDISAVPPTSEAGVGRLRLVAPEIELPAELWRMTVPEGVLSRVVFALRRNLDRLVELLDEHPFGMLRAIPPIVRPSDPAFSNHQYERDLGGAGLRIPRQAGRPPDPRPLSLRPPGRLLVGRDPHLRTPSDLVRPRPRAIDPG